MIVHGSYSVAQSVVGGLIVFAVKCAAMDLQPLEKLVGEAALKAMESNDITVKAAAITGGMDESTFRKALRGEAYRHLTVVHMLKLGPKFWIVFSASLMWLVAKRHLEDIAETVNVRKGA